MEVVRSPGGEFLSDETGETVVIFGMKGVLSEQQFSEE